MKELLKIILALLLPPLGVFLTILGYIPGIVHTAWVMKNRIKSFIMGLRTISFKTEKRKRYYESFGRFVFYSVVVYGALLCGGASVIKTEIINMRFFVLTMLFVPFLFTYTMLFELSDKKMFPERLTDDSVWKKSYGLGGKHMFIFLFGIICGILFLFALFYSLKNNFIPYELVPVIIPFEFLLVGTLYASKYNKLELERSKIKKEDFKEEYEIIPLWKLRSTKRTLFVSLIVMLASFVFAVASGIVSFENDELIKRYALSVIFGSCFIGLFYFIISNTGDADSLEKKFIYENVIARESLFLTSIVIVPFVVGVFSSSAYFDDYFYLSFDALFTGSVFSVLGMLVGWGLILENLRYIGKYNESYKYRSYQLRRWKVWDDNIMINDIYQLSVNNFMYLFSVILIFMPWLIVYANYDYNIIISFVIYVYLVLFLVVLLLRPYSEMCFDSIKFSDSGRVMYKTNSNPVLLVCVKVLGLIVLVYGLFLGINYYQKDKTYVKCDKNNGMEIWSDIHKIKITKDMQFDREGFMAARLGSDYKKKKVFLIEYLSSDKNEGYKLRAQVICDALRFDGVDKNMLTKERGFKNINKRYNIDISSIVPGVSKEEVYFVFSSFLTILVGFVLSSIFIKPEMYSVTRKVGAAIITQAIIVVWIGLDVLLNNDNINYDIMYLEKYVIISYLYIAIALKLLLLVALQNYLKSSKQNVQES